jgi:phosphoribosylformylglycinamidine cyclo-ligase
MGQQNDAYARAGVDIAAGQRATELMKTAVQATYGREVLAGLGAFGGLYDAAALKEMAAPVLVASTDGVGTKTKVAARLNRWETIGQDLVNHCVNDILVQGARPLFFLDYVASSKLDPEQIAAVVAGAAQGCQANGCALLGGETAEMPGVYEPGEIDLVGTIIGVVEKGEIVDGTAVTPGDLVLALPATGLHTNGYTLARKLLDDLEWEQPRADLGQSVGEALLAVHRSYLHEITTLRAGGVPLRGLAHITGGGVLDNLPRILPQGTGATIRRGRWPEPPIFKLLADRGDLSVAELFRTFNMGLGMLVIIAPHDLALAQQILPDELYLVGEIVVGEGVTVIA